jgi:hypothetical protein
MNPLIATFVYLVGMALLFWFDRDADVKTSKVGVILLSLIVITGYWHIKRAFRQDSSHDPFKLAAFLVGLAYNLTEAGFRMADPVWIMFLLATFAVTSEVVHQEIPSLETVVVRGRVATSGQAIPA